MLWPASCATKESGAFTQGEGAVSEEQRVYTLGGWGGFTSSEGEVNEWGKMFTGE